MTHGGKREGAGRKPLGSQTMVKRTFTITHEQDSWLEEIVRETGSNKSEIVRGILERRQALKRSLRAR